MKILALITARKNSKRLKNKNIKNFKKKPLIYWTIKFTKKLKLFDNILVSTDSKYIQKICLKNKVMAPWLRPKNLSTSKAKSIDVAFHAINWYEKNISKIDYLVLFQPTSPYRSKATFKKMFKLFKNFGKKSVVSFSEIITKGKQKFNINNNKIFQEIDIKKKIYNVNGNLYFNSIKNLRKYKSFVNKETVPYILKEKKELIDIDTIEDWKRAKKF